MKLGYIIYSIIVLLLWNERCSATTPMYLYLKIQGYHVGGGYLNSTLSNQGMGNPLSDCDSITIELHDPIAPYVTICTYTSMLNVLGEIEFSWEYSCISANANYYIVIKHRNAMETWSAAPVAFIPGVQTVCNFTDPNQVYGGNVIEIQSGVYALYSGDINQDGAIDAFDYLLLDNDLQQGSFGYHVTDLNGDGVVDAFDHILLDANLTNGINAARP
jgi:hypothetical protein